LSSGTDPFPALGRHSQRLKELARLRNASDRKRAGAFLLEGPHLFEQLLEDLDSGPRHPYRPRFFVVSESYLERFQKRGLDKICRRLRLEGAHVSDAQMKRLSDTESPQGVLAEIPMPDESRDLTGAALRMAKRRHVRLVLAEGVSDPGNLGTLARSAAGLGAAMFMAHGGADPFGPKSLRATAGAFLAFPYGEITQPDRFLKKLAGVGVKLIASVARGGRSPRGYQPPSRLVLMLGSEAHGLPSGWVRHADVRLRIPLVRGVESLNVSTAGSILIHHLCGPSGPESR